ncbi:hypothetical protein [Spiroplasma endosymbiont of Thecophora atra]|uniref:hypothetical protein n=1 Tax=Spiroplasma endosymbiont of Thecophora atra TaxID=3066294 RepID=UPI0030D18C97
MNKYQLPANNPKPNITYIDIKTGKLIILWFPELLSTWPLTSLKEIRYGSSIDWNIDGLTYNDVCSLIIPLNK